MPGIDGGSPGKPLQEVALSLSGRSELANELATLEPQVRELLGLPDALVLTLDVVIAAARLLLDDSDPRPWHERLDDLSVLAAQLAPDADRLLDEVRAIASDPSALVQRLRSRDAQRFVHRLVGEARFNRLRSAMKADGAVIVLGVRRAMRSLMPLALALDDCVAFLTPGQVATLEGFGKFGDSLLRMVVAADASLDKVLDLGLPFHELTLREGELEPLTNDISAGIDEIADHLHEVLEGRSSEVLLELSTRLSRKVQGARDALETSADGVSQAANSLVEFVDRLLREAFAEEDVMGWVSRNRRQGPELSYEDKNLGRMRPTKRAQALCFVFGGHDHDESNVLNEMAAAGVVAARTRLQQLKHADDGGSDEVPTLRRLIAAVEGFVVFSVRVGWIDLSDEELLSIRIGLGDVESQTGP